MLYVLWLLDVLVGIAITWPDGGGLLGADNDKNVVIEIHAFQGGCARPCLVLGLYGGFCHVRLVALYTKSAKD